MDQLHAIIIKHEGLRLKPYTDTVGKLTIGVGRNLTDVGITQDEALMLLDNDLKRCENQLVQYDWYTKLDEVRQGVLIELVFNMGLSKVLEFKNMIEALRGLDYKTASKELLNSQWPVQVGSDRANDMADRLRNGRYS